MKPIVLPAIEEYAEKNTAAPSALLQKLFQKTHASTHLPQMLVGSNEGGFLRLLVRLLSAERVLEIGTFTGYSALSMAEGLPAHGTMITCDINKETTDLAKRFWARSKHGRKIQLRLGPALETLSTLKGPFDLVFLDADKENYVRYWNACVPLVRRGGLLVADNVLWSGRVLNPKNSTDRALVRFNRLVAKDKRVEAVMLTVRDGMTLAWKK